MSSYVLLLFLIILNVVQLFTTAIVVTVHALAIVVNVVSQHTDRVTVRLDTHTRAQRHPIAVPNVWLMRIVGCGARRTRTFMRPEGEAARRSDMLGILWCYA